MEHINLKYIDKNYEKFLLNLLHNQVFHLTTKKAFKSISEDSFIYHNRNKRFPLNSCSSSNSFGRKRGCICLFDLKNKKNKIIQDTLDCYYFLGPEWFKEYFDDCHTEFNLAYFILDQKYYDILIPNEEASKSYKETKKLDQYIPKTECWFQGDMPYKYFSKVYLVEIFKSAPPADTLAHDFHKKRLIDKSTLLKS